MRKKNIMDLQIIILIVLGFFNLLMALAIASALSHLIEYTKERDNEPVIGLKNENENENRGLQDLPNTPDYSMNYDGFERLPKKNNDGVGEDSLSSE